MNISAVGFQPYIYSTRAVSSASLGKVSGIEDDALAGGVDYTGLTGENENPLGLGKSKNFADIIASQMSMSAMNAARVMQPAIPDITDPAGMPKDTGDVTQIAEMTADAAQDMMQDQDTTLFQRMNAANAYEMNMIA